MRVAVVNRSVVVHMARSELSAPNRFVELRARLSVAAEQHQVDRIRHESLAVDVIVAVENERFMGHSAGAGEITVSVPLGHGVGVTSSIGRPCHGPASRWFQFLELLLPQRIRDEEIGDALEEIAALVERSAGRWQIRLKIASTTFWLLINAVREVSSAVRGKKSE